MIEFFSNKSNFFDLAVICLGKYDEVMMYAKKLRDCDKNFDLMVIGNNERQLYSLFELKICGFIFEKDVDEYFRKQLMLIFSNKDIKIGFYQIVLTLLKYILL